MAATVRSFSRVASSTPIKASPVPCPKPAGLTVGDLMVMFVSADPFAPTSAPSGWSLLGSNTSVARHLGYVYTKTADAADVAATAFTVGNTAPPNTYPNCIFVCIYAVQDWGSIEYSAAQAYASGASTFAGLDPAATGDLILAFCDRSAGSATTFSTTNNNPTWTSDHNASINLWDSCYHGSYNADTATGTCQWATTVARFEAMVVISPAATGLTPVSQTITPAYDMRALVAQTLTPVYGLRQLAAQTLTPTYGVLNLAAQTLTPAYLVRQLAAQSLTPVYDVRTAVAQTFTPVYDIRQLAAQTLSPIYNITQFVAQTLTPTYDIQAAELAAVAQTLTPTYLIRNLVAQTLTPTYLVRELVGASLTPTYAILFVVVPRHTKKLHSISRVAIMEDPPRINKRGIIDIRDTIQRLPNKGVAKI